MSQQDRPINRRSTAPIAVTGIGITSSIGMNTGEFSNSLRAGKSGIARWALPAGPLVPVGVGARLPDFSLVTALQQVEGVPEPLRRKIGLCAGRSPLGVQAAVLAALEAWIMSGLDRASLDPQRLGIIVAGSNLNPRYSYGLHEKFQQDPEYLTPRYPLHYMDTDYVGTLSEIFQAQGEGFTVGGASASGNVAIIKACQAIGSDVIDACLVIGALADLSPMELQGFYNIGALGGRNFHDQPDKACRPFDLHHEGFIYGQAGACMLLESTDSAQQRGVPELARVTGGALVLDGNRLSDPNAEGEARAMTQALVRSGLNPSDIDYLNAHGTASPLGDETEIKAVKGVFKEHVPRLWINSTKGLTGHCLTAAGVVEAIAVVIQLQQGFLHPNKNLENPIDSECRFCPPESTLVSIRRAMSNSFGFGGIDTSIILERGGL
ncbi:MAG: malonyl-ACP decarboxylase [Acidobacteriota bacterium]|nr:malonyl-ACP decarboxylase [Acidobacteriota bacterium]